MDNFHGTVTCRIGIPSAERERIQAESTRKLGEYKTAAPGRAGWSKKKLAREMMKEYIAEREKHGKWDDEWVIHPLPTINEPEKAMCWLTPRADLGQTDLKYAYR